MIPLQLHIKNFLSYGPQQQTIDFGNHPLVCLSGKNGHGKSALLDAITWAIWGQARKIREAVKADEGLLRLGQTQMLVTLDFMFNGQRYRVRREFSKYAGKLTTSLDFGIITGDSDLSFKALTDKTIRTTQEKIEKTLGLNYESFVNSAFLRQGQSNEFSQKSPKERKEILANILGLHKYEQLRRLALEKIKKAGNEQDQLVALRERLNTILSQKEMYLAQQQAVDERQRTTIAQQAELDKQLLGFSLQKEQVRLQLQAAELAAAQKTLNEQMALKEKLLLYKEQEQKLRMELQQSYLQLVQDKKAKLEQGQQALQLATQVAAIEKRLQELTTLLRERTAVEALFDKRKTYYQKYVALGNVVNAELSGLHHKQKLVHDDDNPSCPLCEQNLSASRKRFIKTKFITDEQAFTHRRSRLAKLVTQLKEVLIAQHERIKLFEKHAQEQALLEQQAKELRDRAGQQVTPEQYRTMQQEFAAILPVEQWLLTHENYIAATQLVATALKACEQISQDNNQQQRQLTQQLATLGVQEQRFAEQQQVLNRAKEQCAHEKGKLEQLKQLLTNTEQELATIDIQFKKAAQQLGEYQTVASALGKDGIQALLIEEAIPEIEQEANRILAKLTNNQAQLFIESVRDLKKGGTKETLDINISDPLGIRAYELFSGGEAFRIDFALRVAISKLLARRAGTSLQTLIIDEGFGSQDEEGLGHIMDALYKIQDDFAKVIIVSHLPMMKDQFPVHFMIEKGAQGSVVSVISG